MAQDLESMNLQDLRIFTLGGLPYGVFQKYMEAWFPNIEDSGVRVFYRTVQFLSKNLHIEETLPVFSKL